ncbi:hypothetical protein BDV06DRAFT_113614 [Aspergillus oleicola]
MSIQTTMDKHTSSVGRVNCSCWRPTDRQIRVAEYREHSSPLPGSTFTENCHKCSLTRRGSLWNCFGLSQTVSPRRPFHRRHRRPAASKKPSPALGSCRLLALTELTFLVFNAQLSPGYSAVGPVEGQASVSQPSAMVNLGIISQKCKTHRWRRRLRTCGWCRFRSRRVKSHSHRLQNKTPVRARLGFCHPRDKDSGSTSARPLRWLSGPRLESSVGTLVQPEA